MQNTNRLSISRSTSPSQRHTSIRNPNEVISQPPLVQARLVNTDELITENIDLFNNNLSLIAENTHLRTDNINLVAVNAHLNQHILILNQRIQFLEKANSVQNNKIQRLLKSETEKSDTIGKQSQKIQELYKKINELKK